MGEALESLDQTTKDEAEQNRFPDGSHVTTDGADVEAQQLATDELRKQLEAIGAQLAADGAQGTSLPSSAPRQRWRPRPVRRLRQSLRLRSP